MITKPTARDRLIKSFEEEAKKGFKYTVPATGGYINLTRFGVDFKSERVYLDFTTQMLYEVWVRAHKHCA